MRCRTLRAAVAVVVLAGAALLDPVPAAAQVQTLATGIDEKAVDSPEFGDGAVFYYIAPRCNVAGHVNETSPARIGRVPAAIGASRTVFEFNPLRAAGHCNPFRLESNLLVDATHVYWVDNQGSFGLSALKKLPRDANPGDAPVELKFIPTAPSSAEHQLANGGGKIYLIVRNGLTSSFVSEVDKNAPVGGPLPQFYATSVFNLNDVSFDGRWVWWRDNNNLLRYDTFSPGVGLVDTNVSSYYSEGYDDNCSPLGCDPFNQYYVGKGNQLILRDSIQPGFSFPLFTSPRANVSIRNIVRDQFNVFFTEVEPLGLFLDANFRLFRHPLGGASASLIYGPFSRALFGLSSFDTDLQYLYFFDFNNNAPRIDRIANNAAAIPIYDVRALGLEITQGVQDRNNNVRLIAGKPTVVRFYVKSDGATNVNDVAARLSGFNQLGSLGSLEPVNRTGKRITVKTSPARENLDDTFLFQLPDAWTENGNLSLTATVNPFNAILEDDKLDNSSTLAPVVFSPSPNLRVEYVSFWYTLNNMTISSNYADLFASQLYMSKLYPLAYGILGPQEPGLRFSTQLVFDNAIASRVARTDKDCDRFKDDKAKPPTDDRNMCAAAYAGERIAAMKRAGELKSDRHHYGDIAQAFAPDGSNPLFTRGFARGDRISMGPAGPASNETYLNYGAHEVGHTVGRPHPFFGATCGHSLDDVDYPYLLAAIGDTFQNKETRIAGLDIGEFFFNPITFRDASTHRDFMSYCGTYWTSDHSFEQIYQWLLANPAGAPGGNAPGQAGAPFAGDWLIATGSLAPASGTGGFGVVRRTDAVADPTAPTPGGYTLQLRGGGALLASHGFSAAPIQDGQAGQLAFELVVPFAPGTTELRVIEDATAAQLASAPVSASPPSIGGVALPGAPDPVDGIVTVTWNASDPDGDPLSFDVFATRDGGVTFEPIQLSVPGSPFQLDSALLAGGPTQLRVVATDGVQTASALSPLFTVAGRAPQVAILSPADGTSVQWNQLVSFQGAASDLQDEDIPDASFVWANAYGTLGTGRTLNIDTLQVGANLVTLTVTNSLGIPGQDTTTVNVGDVLTPLPPALSVAPTTIAFSVANDETTLQSTTITVTNAGALGLVFDVATDAGWALVDGSFGAVNQTAPATFTITADPTLVLPGVTTTALLTFTNKARPSDVIQVPVSISKGNVFEQTGATDFDGDGVVDLSDNCASVTNANQLDGDADGFGDACDRCPYASDPLQEDTGGTGAGSAPDGIGDACQCGDVTGDGRITLSDAVTVQRSLLVPPTASLSRPQLCDVNGSGSCTLSDVVVIRRALLQPPTQAIQPLCAPAAP